MRNISFSITLSHLFSPKSAFNAESKSYIISFLFNVYRTLKIIQSNNLTSNSISVQSNVCN